MQFFETLQSRVLYSARVTGGTLVITGNDNPEAITVRIVGSKLRILQTGEPERLVAKSDVRRITANLGGGADSIHIDTRLTLPCTLVGGTGRDTLYGAGGSDRIIPGSENDLVRGGLGKDILDLSSSNAQLIVGGSSGSGGFAGIEDLRTGSGNDIIDLSQLTEPLVVYSGAGNDIITGSPLNDVIFAGDGNDKVYGGDGNDEIHGGNGNDLLSGLAGDDWIAGDAGIDSLFGGAGRDWLDSRDGLFADKIVGNDDGNTPDTILVDAADTGTADAVDVILR